MQGEEMVRAGIDRLLHGSIILKIYDVPFSNIHGRSQSMALVL